MLNFFDSVSCETIIAENEAYEQVLAMVRLRCIYDYYFKIRINNDGKDGKDIDVEAIGYLEGYQEHKEESGARE